MRQRSSSRPSDPARLAEAVARHGVQDERVLDAIRRVPRAEFVPAAQRERAYEDVPVPIGRGQVTTQPSLVAAMIEALGLTGHERVLEVGTGLGWQTAVLAALAGEVWSVERFPELAESARESLARTATHNAHVVVGDGTRGLAERAPFDAVLVAAAHPSVPPPLPEQLAVGGRLVQPIGPGGRERVVLFERAEGGLAERETVIGAHFVRLYGEHGFKG
jgi:protein-L-isoaspartate(D-aspartate) O-methyltransferase